MKTIVLKAIRVYQSLAHAGIATPLLLGSFSGCRSWPTCSEYAVSAIEKAGVIRGGTRALIRFLRCSPLTAHAHNHA